MFFFFFFPLFLFFLFFHLVLICSPLFSKFSSSPEALKLTLFYEKLGNTMSRRRLASPEVMLSLPLLTLTFFLTFSRLPPKPLSRVLVHIILASTSNISGWRGPERLCHGRGPGFFEILHGSVGIGNGVGRVEAKKQQLFFN